MITYFDSSLTSLSIHRVGNKTLNEPVLLSDKPLVIKDEVLEGLIMKYFLGAFQNSVERYGFHHPSGPLQLNEIYNYCEKIFESPKSLHTFSKKIANQLYSVADHPNIKPGELYITHVKDLQVDGEMLDAIGIFKSESKEPYLTVAQAGPSFQLGYEENAINIKKLDKGCLVLNTNKTGGYKVCVIDHSNRSEAVYWIDDFLQLKILYDDFSMTNVTLSMYKSFVTDKLEQHYDMSRADKIDLLNRSINYFKQKEEFDLKEFSDEVIGDAKGVKLFLEYKKDYEKNCDYSTKNSFLISAHAVKKQARNYKSVLKLDKNFHIYIHGDKKLIEKGFDVEKNLSFYKVFFKEEA